MNLTGLGVVFAGGAGVPALRGALASGVPPAAVPYGREGVPALAVPAAALAGNPLLAPARRADRFCKLAMAAALEAWEGCPADPARVGIILATAFGPHATVFRFVNDMLDFGDAKASPTIFSQSVHAAAASMIASAAKIRGPVLNLADLALPFEEALALAGCWLEEGRCDAVLAGAADELSDVLAHVVRRFWGDRFVPGEGAAFFRLERTGGARLALGCEVAPGAALRLVNEGGLGADVPVECDAAGAEAPPGALTPFWGSTRLGAAFYLAAAEVMRRDGRLLPGGAPLTDGRIEVLSACGLRRRVIALGE